MAEQADETTNDGFLGGTLILRQPKRGHRAGHDAILLAASTDARAGHVVIDLGAGVGTAGLALASRVNGIDLVLVEIDPALAALAVFNAETNSIPVRVVAADVTAPETLRNIGLADRVLMNPPFHADARHRPSPDPARRIAHSASKDTLKVWIGAAHRLLKSRGALTMIWRADDLPQVLQTVGAKFGSLEIQPVHGARGKPAIRMMLRATKGGRAPLMIHESTILDGSDLTAENAINGKGILPLANRS